MNNLIGLSVNDGDDILLVANGDGLSIGAPAEVDVLPLGLHRVCALPSWGGRGEGEGWVSLQVWVIVKHTLLGLLTQSYHGAQDISFSIPVP